MDSAVQNMIAALHNPEQVVALDVAKHVAHALFFGARHLLSDGSRQVEILCELWLEHFRNALSAVVPLHVPARNKKYSYGLTCALDPHLYD